MCSSMFALTQNVFNNYYFDNCATGLEFCFLDCHATILFCSITDKLMPLSMLNPKRVEEGTGWGV